MRRVLTAFSLALLAGCAAPDVHAPPFANKPYEPFSRTSAVAIARAEWRLWGVKIVDTPPPGPSSDASHRRNLRVPPPADYAPANAREKAERDPGFWQEVGLYWWIGMNAGHRTDRWTGKHDAMGRKFLPLRDGDYAWSAAFISYVMRMAGAGPHFPYAPDHARYIDYAWRAAHREVQHPLLLAENPKDYAPRLGDLICAGRDRAARMRYRDLPSSGFFPSHCAIVVGGEAGVLDTIGGNVNDEVAMTHVPVAASGTLDQPDGTIVDPRYDWFVVLKVLYAH